MKRFNFFKYTTLANKVHTTYFDYWFFKHLTQGGEAPTEPVEGEGTEFTLSPSSNKKLAVVTPKGDTSQNTLSGKNLLNIATVGWGYVSSSGNVTGTTSPENWLSDYIKVTAGSTYTFSYFNYGEYTTLRLSIAYYDENKTFISRDAQTTGTSTTRTFTIPEGCVWVRVSSYRTPVWTEAERVSWQPQFELGATASATFEPYCGGIPSPNPEYPQDVNVVTGTQTLTITNGEDVQTYPITLGSVELCKIGDYQDYIYKSDDKWYVHKATSNYVLSSTTITGIVTVQGLVCGIAKPSAVDKINGRAGSFCSKATLKLASDTLFEGAYYENPLNFILCGNGTDTLETLRTKYDGGKMYYVLATPTDTEITDATLLSNLNTLLTDGYLKKGTNTIKTTATGTNLPTIIYIKTN